VLRAYQATATKRKAPQPALHTPPSFPDLHSVARAAADHEPAGGLLGDRSRERGAGQFERAADRQRFVGLPLGVPFLDVEVEAGQPVVLGPSQFFSGAASGRPCV
jgi:hypothetical protein